jgi:hypothetical protein
MTITQPRPRRSPRVEVVSRPWPTRQQNARQAERLLFFSLSTLGVANMSAETMRMAWLDYRSKYAVHRRKDT